MAAYFKYRSYEYLVNNDIDKLMHELSTEGRSMCQANCKCYVASRVRMTKLMNENAKEIGRNVFEDTILALAH